MVTFNPEAVERPEVEPQRQDPAPTAKFVHPSKMDVNSLLSHWEYRGEDGRHYVDAVNADNHITDTTELPSEAEARALVDRLNPPA